MNLRQLAEQDLAFILEDTTTGFGWDIKLTDPSGMSAAFVGMSDDIGSMIDPDTGVAVSGRTVSISLRMTSIMMAGMVSPVGVTDSASKPWLVEFDDILGNQYVFKVQKSMPDRMVGIVTCILEFYDMTPFVPPTQRAWLDGDRWFDGKRWYD